MTCSGCKANEERLRQGYEWVDEKVSPMYKCTCSKREKTKDRLMDYVKVIFVLPLVVLIFCLTPVFWISDKVEEWWISDSHEND